ncbi:reduced folate carrier [Dictyocaulus viviparus]|uniref:Reduced folate carrier n=1 Tax=Dictyocaulus viviparus TaxID=29172 RepID=A0A0D8XCM3_DICVI|nr:reduced folate carrier [Dictyocaulus viviparus]
MHWKTTTILLCIYGVVKEFRPATPFLTPYLISSSKNLTLDEVYSRVFPFWTYSYMVFLIPVFFLTDILRYKPVIVLEGACLSLTWILLVWGKGILEMQLMQIIFGIASAAEIAYYSYVYAVVDEEKYRRVSSYVRSATLTGKLLAYGLAQVLISTGTSSYLTLNQISLVAVIFVFFIALVLPPVTCRRVQKQTDIVELSGNCLFERRSMEQESICDGCREIPKWSIRRYFVSMLGNFAVFKDNPIVLKWSTWWALTSCGIFQVYNYIQSLWLEMQPDPNKVENGLVEVIGTSFGAMLSFIIQFADIDWIRFGDIILAIYSGTAAILLALISQTVHVLLAYSGYICVTAVYNMLITVASCNIAEQLNSINSGLVFGWNTFVAVVLQTSLTLLVVDSHGLNFNIRMQFVVYASYFSLIAVLYFTLSVYAGLKHIKTKL